MLNYVLTTVLVSALLVRPTLAAQEECFEDVFGNVNCRNRLSTGARIGIAIGSAAVVIIGLALCAYQRRRRVRAYNQQFVTNPVYGQQTGAQNGGYPPQPAYYPQNNGYPQNGGYAGSPYAGQDYGVQSPQPAYAGYAPPPGAPPAKYNV
ncbi:hypothetical protein SISSUDRAFT_1050817 [Sistotremastrum suecicum HHB10207 ss-3]|uniref:Uncharacterized protein n=1 Tax=Sistotremastrum suecicum HHB10207 ss-3 TaxID=1314776 RepID=A0A166AYB3_9AGAM|nr:hypothetical protein SISSUDRAFT_1050817 [Sistotremastrum suecicum HHB10207 ss-3]